jgi:hypothetical protein
MLKDGIIMKKIIFFSIFFCCVFLTGNCLNAAALTSVTDTPSNCVVSASSTHTINFVISASDTVGKIAICFNGGFILTGISLNTFTLVPTGTLSRNADTVIYTVTNPETITSGSLCAIVIAGVTNASVCANTYSITVTTYTPQDTIIDGPTQSGTFTLTGNAIKFVTPPQILTVSETSMAISIIVCDASGNTDTAFNNTVTLSTSSNTGVFSVSDVAWQDTTIITFLAGTATFYYIDLSAGDFTISAYCPDYDTGRQSVKIVEYMQGPISPNSPAFTVLSPTGQVTVSIPAGAFDSPVYVIITENPSSNAIDQANNSTLNDPHKKLVQALDYTVCEISAYVYTDGGYVDLSQPVNPISGQCVSCTIPYGASGATGILEDGLRFCRLDTNTNGWIILSTIPVLDRNRKEAVINLSSFSFYRLVSLSVSSDLGGVIVYPNPFETDKARDGMLKFVMLPRQVTIKIYTLAGELVRTLDKNDNFNRLEWDGKNERREKVASGLYFYVISSPQAANKITGKIAVISK